MTIPDFDKYGLLPSGIYKATWREIETKLGTDNHRLNLIHAAQQFCIEQLWEYNGRLFLGGSLTSNKKIPSDADLAINIQFTSTVQKAKAFRLHASKEELKKRYNVDINVSSPIGEDFSLFFQKLKPEHASLIDLPPSHLRGIIEIEPWKVG